MIIDWSKSSSSKPLVNEGNYKVKILSWERRKAKSTGNSVVTIKADIVSPGEFLGAEVEDTITLTEAALWRLAAFVQACLCVSADMLPQMDTESQEFENLLNACKGRKMWWSIIIDTYDGKQRNKTAGKEPYTPAKSDNPAFDLATIEDVPEWVKGK